MSRDGNIGPGSSTSSAWHVNTSLPPRSTHETLANPSSLVCPHGKMAIDVRFLFREHAMIRVECSGENYSISKMMMLLHALRFDVYQSNVALVQGMLCHNILASMTGSNASMNEQQVMGALSKGSRKCSC